MELVAGGAMPSPCASHSSCRFLPSMILRALLLFIIGVVFFIVADVMRGVTRTSYDYNYTIFGFVSPCIWVPLFCGSASGFLSPHIDAFFGIFGAQDHEWSSVIRCIALFLGINHATLRIDFASYMQLFFTLLALSFGLWWCFDRSVGGLVLGLITSGIATVIYQSFAWKGILRLSHPVMLAWLPCLFFSGCITVGLVGKQLAKLSGMDCAKFKKE
ncbi:unnamed protein product [Protopolystoma xenopodis]|uniref:Insulin-induced gene 1 protein n=1 Tax=Protopolystoma xenopodis TaxID=117903 RepID=A0A3S4ZME4_9PLAT|nr:unnamed protein product [Protopolystoma xenopodis]